MALNCVLITELLSVSGSVFSSLFNDVILVHSMILYIKADSTVHVYGSAHVACSKKYCPARKHILRVCACIHLPRDIVRTCTYCQKVISKTSDPLRHPNRYSIPSMLSPSSLSHCMALATIAPFCYHSHYYLYHNKLPRNYHVYAYRAVI